MFQRWRYLLPIAAMWAIMPFVFIPFEGWPGVRMLALWYGGFIVVGAGIILLQEHRWFALIFIPATVCLVWLIAAFVW
jgi:hypothetical protein